MNEEDDQCAREMPAKASTTELGARARRDSPRQSLGCTPSAQPTPQDVESKPTAESAAMESAAVGLEIRRTWRRRSEWRRRLYQH
jgi:hypothetical protein